jgi:hypothetical protein
MSPEAITQNDVAQATKAQRERNAKPVADRKDEIKLKGNCLLATKSDINELNASSSIVYALVCKDALISLHDMMPSLPLAVANILQEYSDVFPTEMPPGLPPL